jgi:hypothetical protein
MSPYVYIQIDRDEKNNRYKKKKKKEKRFFFVLKLSHCYFFMPGENEEEEEEDEKALSTDIDEPLLYFEYIKLANIAINIANKVKPTNITIAHC